MHNIVHNMDDDDMVLPAHVTLRNGVYQYVRRVPDDVAHAFAAARIQRSLKTRSPSDARLRAAQIDIEIERQFTEARASKGVVVTAVISEAWKWPDWERFVDWFKATLVEDDTAVRLRKLKGQHLATDARKGSAIWLEEPRLRELLHPPQCRCHFPQ